MRKCRCPRGWRRLGGEVGQLGFLCSVVDRVEVRTFEDERPLSIEVNVVTCGVVDPPRIVDPVHLRSPDITASRSCLVGPDDFGLASLQAADGFGTCDADV